MDEVSGKPGRARDEQDDARFAELGDGLPGVEEGRGTVGREHVRLDLPQVMRRRKQAQDMACAQRVSSFPRGHKVSPTDGEDVLSFDGVSGPSPWSARVPLLLRG